jgi:hypothetical protein
MEHCSSSAVYSCGMRGGVGVRSTLATSARVAAHQGAIDLSSVALLNFYLAPHHSSDKGPKSFSETVMTFV